MGDWRAEVWKNDIWESCGLEGHDYGELGCERTGYGIDEAWKVGRWES